MKSRTIEAIVLAPKKITGTYSFLSLETGNEISGHVVAELPITDNIIARVEQLGRAQQQPFHSS